jgi:hypothetical protein
MGLPILPIVHLSVLIFGISAGMWSHHSEVVGISEGPKEKASTLKPFSATLPISHRVTGILHFWANDQAMLLFNSPRALPREAIPIYQSSN